MNFDDSKEEAAFRAQAVAWLDSHAKRRQETDVTRSLEFTNEQLGACRAWQKTKAEAGFARITWPSGMGGMNGTPMQAIIFEQEEAKYDVPGGAPFMIGLGMCIPTLMTYGTDEDRKRHVLPAVMGDEIWSQMFSEPAGGSDVAALRTRAEKDGDSWIINGSKVWTTGAMISDFGLLLVRTDPEATKHKGLTMFYFSLKSPGVEIKPIKQASGVSEFCEIFLNDVAVPDAQRLGEVGQGWQVALTTLMHERLAVGGGQGGGIDTPHLMKLAASIEVEDGLALGNAAVREKIADWHVRSAGLRYTTMRTMTALSKGEQPGPEASVAKVIVAAKLQDLSAFALELQGEMGIVQGPFQESWLWAPGLRIAGGTDEILRNIIAERVLGLPADLRVDKDIPFKRVPTGER